MKQLIAGKVYNTHHAELLVHLGLPEDYRKLYRAHHGAYFLHIAHGSPDTEHIEPIEPPEAIEMMRKYAPVDIHRREFPELYKVR